MKRKLENACGKIITKTFKMASPIKRQIINSNCEVHLYIQENAFDILKNNGYKEEANFLNQFKENIERGLVWADEDFKSYYHFYNPTEKKGMYGNAGNALTIATKYYNNAINFARNGDYNNAMAYFGASCHIIQDLTIPQHAKRQLLDNHKQFETYVKYNYKKIKRFKTEEKPIKFSTIQEYVDYNSTSALNFDYMYKNIKSEDVKFYLTAFKALNLAQRTTAGCMLSFYEDVNKIIESKNLH
ncbi:MAG: zinc dependent phospholipase C family protein [Terrisporobacter sp.]|uniref:zinc dependent phospholipase C family protein n=1 Tax=Terrisporobacter sp. TaxID=1965305 RepID=UPI002FC83414